MTHHEQIDAFSNELDAMVERFRREFDLTYADVVGTLHMKAWLMCKEASDQNS